MATKGFTLIILCSSYVRIFNRVSGELKAILKILESAILSVMPVWRTKFQREEKQSGETNILWWTKVLPVSSSLLSPCQTNEKGQPPTMTTLGSYDISDQQNWRVSTVYSTTFVFRSQYSHTYSIVNHSDKSLPLSIRPLICGSC